MTVCCPDCGFTTDNLPPTHKCPECGEFSHDWLIYDWEEFVAIKRRHIKYNVAILGALLINVLLALALQSSNAFQWFLTLLAIPAIISWLRCRRQLRARSAYKGHESGVVFPWFSELGGL